MNESYDSMSAEELQQRIQELELLLETTSREMVRLQKQIVDWHTAMFGAICLILKAHRQNLIIEREYLLNLMPTRIDCLVLKKNSDIPIDLDMFRFFRKHNVIEFKSYSDDLDIDVILRTISYATSYLSQEGHARDVSVDEVTITIIRSAFPVKLFRELRQTGWKIEEAYHNIFQLSGFIRLPIQIVVAKDLDRAYLPLQILTNKAKEEDVRSFTEFRNSLTEKAEKEYADAVIWACAQANRELFKKIEEDEKMKGVMYDILKPDIDKMVDEARRSGAEDMANSVAETMIREGSDGGFIMRATGFDRSRIDSIAHKLDRNVVWNEATT